MSDRDRVLARINEGFATKVPYNAWLGLEAIDFGPGRAVFRLPARPDHVGDPERGVPHGGAITAAMDATAGAAVFLALETPLRIATLDLRLDYLRAAPAGCDLFFSASCIRVATQVAFTRGVAHAGDETDPFVSSVGTFMVFRGQASPLMGVGGEES